MSLSVLHHALQSTVSLIPLSIMWFFNPLCIYLLIYMQSFADPTRGAQPHRPVVVANNSLIWIGIMLTKVNFFKCCTSIFNIMCGSWAFHSVEFYLGRVENEKQYTLLFAYIVKSSYFPYENYMKLKMVWKTHYLPYDIQSYTRLLSKFFGKSKVWDSHFCCIWNRISSMASVVLF